MTQTGIPASGLYGPGDYAPNFVTLEEMFETTDWYAPLADILNSERMLELVKRCATVTAILDLAHDLDARGLVVVPEVATHMMGRLGYYQAEDCIKDADCGDAGLHVWNTMMREALLHPSDDTPPDPNTGS